MLHQSKIRKSALGLIYAALLQKADPGDFSFELFWSIALEKETDHYRLALTKGILHATRALGELGDAVVQRAEAYLQETQGDMTLLPQREETEGCLTRTKSLLAALKELQYSLNDKRRDTTDPLEQLCRRVLGLVQTLCDMSANLQTRLADDVKTEKAEGLAAALRHWDRHLRECAALTAPLNLDDKSEYAGLLRKARALNELRPEAENLARETLAHSQEWEMALSRLLRNYVPERLDLVDKSILYLALYELQLRKLKAPIVISEAINLAHEFSGPKSAPFIHGILAAAALETTEQTHG